MARYFVASGGSNTSPYDTWAKAATSIATALTAASSDGDEVVLQHDAVPAGDTELSSDTSYTAAAAITFISASNDGGSAFTPTAMGTSNWIGNSTTNRSVSIFPAANKSMRIFGITLRTAGSTTDNITLHGTGNTGQAEAEQCYFWSGNTGSASRINFGGATAGQPTVTITRQCTFRFGNASQSIQLRGAARWVDYGSATSSSGSVPTELVLFSSNQGGSLELIGSDFRNTTTTLFGDAAGQRMAPFICRGVALGSGASVLATQSDTSRYSVEAQMYSCSIGSTEVTGVYNPFGSCVLDAGIYYTDGVAAKSWKIVTTSACSAVLPFFTPWVDWYNTGTSAVTPRLEILRDGSSTAYTDAEVWGEFGVRETASTSLLTMRSDRAALLSAGSNQATGAGTGSWTGEGGTAWSGKVDTAAPVTPNAAGRMAARVGVAAASATVYVDPQIRVA